MDINPLIPEYLVNQVSYTPRVRYKNSAEKILCPSSNNNNHQLIFPQYNNTINYSNLNNIRTFKNRNKTQIKDRYSDILNPLLQNNKMKINNFANLDEKLSRIKDRIDNMNLNSIYIKNLLNKTNISLQNNKLNDITYNYEPDLYTKPEGLYNYKNLFNKIIYKDNYINIYENNNKKASKNMSLEETSDDYLVKQINKKNTCPTSSSCSTPFNNNIKTIKKYNISDSNFFINDNYLSSDSINNRTNKERELLNNNLYSSQENVNTNNVDVDLENNQNKEGLDLIYSSNENDFCQDDHNFLKEAYKTLPSRSSFTISKDNRPNIANTPMTSLMNNTVSASRYRKIEHRENNFNSNKGSKGNKINKTLPDSQVNKVSKKNSSLNNNNNNLFMNKIPFIISPAKCQSFKSKTVDIKTKLNNKSNSNSNLNSLRNDDYINSDVKKKNKEYESEIKKLNIKLEEKIDIINTQIATRNELENLNMILNNDIKNYKSNEQDLQTKLSINIDELNKIKKQNDDLIEINNKYAADKKEYDKNINKLKKENKKKLQTINKKNEEINKIKEENNNLMMKIEELNNKFIKNNKNLCANSNEDVKVNDELTEKIKEIQNNKDLINNLQIKKEELNNNLNDLNTKYTSLSNENLNLINKINKLKNENNKKNEEFNNKIISFSKENEIIKNKINNFKEKNDKIINENMTLKNNLKEVNNSLSLEKQKNENLNQEKENLSKLNNSNIVEINNLMSQISTLKNNISNLEKEISILKSQNNQNDNVQISQKNIELNEQINKLIEQNNLLTNKLNDKDIEIQKINTLINENKLNYNNTLSNLQLKITNLEKEKKLDDSPIMKNIKKNKSFNSKSDIKLDYDNNIDKNTETFILNHKLEAENKSLLEKYNKLLSEHKQLENEINNLKKDNVENNNSISVFSNFNDFNEKLAIYKNRHLQDKEDIEILNQQISLLKEQIKELLNKNNQKIIDNIKNNFESLFKLYKPKKKECNILINNIKNDLKNI